MKTIYRIALIFMSIGAWWFVTRFTLVNIYGVISVYVLHIDESTIVHPHGIILWSLYIFSLILGTAIVIPIFVYRWLFSLKQSRSHYQSGSKYKNEKKI